MISWRIVGVAHGTPDARVPDAGSEERVRGSARGDRLDPLQRMLLEEIDPTTDTVRIYHLCGRCIPATEIIGVGTFLDAEETDEVV